MTKTKRIEMVYEGGVFKPLEQVDLEEGTVIKVTMGKNRGVLTSRDLDELRTLLKSLPKTTVDFKKLDAVYYEAKMRS
ncbi:MAG: antitoxin family protein [Candidatus Methanospirareceae archaeon]